MITNALFAAITIATMFYSIWMIRSQQRTIDRLTDRLMVQQGHREYMPRPKVEEQEELRQPMSFFDDPTVPLNNHRRSYPNNAEDLDDYEPQ